MGTCLQVWWSWRKEEVMISTETLTIRVVLLILRLLFEF
jgi:hypothetical protein